MPALSWRDPIGLVYLLITERSYFWYLACLVLLGDALLTQLIIRYVPYTEIDFTTYLRHIDVYLSGERDYSLFKGPSGPLVYPAGHVLVHRLMHFITSGGNNMHLAQQLYGVLYLLSQLLTMSLYAKTTFVPNWAVIILPLSKRLHSIYVLRMFNDCWSMPTALSAFWMFCEGRFTAGSVLFSLAISIKMNILLYLPGLLVIMVRSRGILSTISNFATIFAVQVAVAIPFLRSHADEYLANAFEFSRVFLHKWTVNWRMVPEVIFLSKEFAQLLIFMHACALVTFGLGRWCRDDGGTLRVIRQALKYPHRPASLSPISQDDILTILFTSNLIGIIFARSLHYQFYSWYAQQLPLLVFRAEFPILLKLAFLLAIEYSWNVFPSTRVSSSVLLIANVNLLLGIWISYPSKLRRSPKVHPKTR